MVPNRFRNGEVADSNPVIGTNIYMYLFSQSQFTFRLMMQ